MYLFIERPSNRLRNRLPAARPASAPIAYQEAPPIGAPDPAL
jgi:hypothetical protein